MMTKQHLNFENQLILVIIISGLLSIALTDQFNLYMIGASVVLALLAWLLKKPPKRWPGKLTRLFMALAVFLMLLLTVTNEFSVQRLGLMIGTRAKILDYANAHDIMNEQLYRSYQDIGRSVRTGPQYLSLMRTGTTQLMIDQDATNRVVTYHADMMNPADCPYLIISLAGERRPRLQFSGLLPELGLTHPTRHRDDLAALTINGKNAMHLITRTLPGELVPAVSMKAEKFIDACNDTPGDELASAILTFELLDEDYNPDRNLFTMNKEEINDHFRGMSPQ